MLPSWRCYICEWEKQQRGELYIRLVRQIVAEIMHCGQDFLEVQRDLTGLKTEEEHEDKIIGEVATSQLPAHLGQLTRCGWGKNSSQGWGRGLRRCLSPCSKALSSLKKTRLVVMSNASGFERKLWNFSMKNIFLFLDIDHFDRKLKCKPRVFMLCHMYVFLYVCMSIHVCW